MLHRLSPSALVALSFATAILAGSALLMLPACQSRPGGIGFVDALFTATSAVCVTGLITVDTARDWSPLGQTLLGILIQLGGLGMLTFSTFFAILLGRRLSLSQRDVVAGGLAPLRRVDVVAVIRRILVYTVCLEAAGAAALWLGWRARFGDAEALRHAVFHAISAFCNAGFSTFSDNLLAFRGNVVVNAVVMVLVVLGGLGFVVLVDLENRWRYRARLGLHTRMVLATSGILIVTGGVLFFFFESANTLRDAPLPERAMAALFASVTPRTAGFNTIDYGRVTAATLFLTLIFMFIGGSPGSCAGGVKTTVAAILAATARAALGGSDRPAMFRRSIPDSAVRQAQTLVLVGISLVVTATFLLHVTEVGAVSFRSTAFQSLELGFEAMSAFGTVGLSTGVTPHLTPAGKLVLVSLMFVGRVGPLTLAMLLARRRPSGYHFAEEGVLVG